MYYQIDPNHIEEAQDNINSDLTSLAQWAKDRALILNPKKTVSLLLGTPQQRKKVLQRNFQIVVSGMAIPIDDHARNLGLQIDSNLKFSKHIQNLRASSFNKLRSLNKFKNLLPTSVKLSLSSSLIISKLDYCDVVYGPNLSVEDSSLLQKVQNACIRYSYSDLKWRDHVTPVIRKAGWLKMEERRTLHLQCITHNILLTSKPMYLKEKLKKRSSAHSVNIRHRDKLCILSHKLSKFKSSFSYAAAHHYNNVPDEMKNLSKVHFKKCMKTFSIAQFKE